MSKNDMVMVPRELLERAASSAGYEERDELRAILDKSAEQHHGEPVALPQHNLVVVDAPIKSDPHGFVDGWNACVAQLAKLGPLYTSADPGDAGPDAAQFSAGDMATQGARAFASRDAEVERLRKENEGLRAGWYKDESDNNRYWPEELQEAKSELAERDALLRDKSGELIRMAAHLISAPLFALQDLQDEDKKMTRARVDHAVDVADARLKDAAYDLRRISDAMSASFAVERKRS
jgi:hypothetical protein